MLESMLEFMPVLVFGLTYYAFGMYTATAAFIIASLVQIILLKFFKRTITGKHWFGLGLSVVFGGMTLFFRDPRFIMWKPSALYWLFALILWGALLMRKNLIKNMQVTQMPLLASLPDSVWRSVLHAWAVLFVMLGAANLLVANHFSESNWVMFKLAVCPIVLFVFILLQVTYLLSEGKKHNQVK